MIFLVCLKVRFGALRQNMPRNFPPRVDRHWLRSTSFLFFFNVLLTVHLIIFILAINQLDAQNLFYNKFIICLYMFRAPCAHHQAVKIVLYSIWYHHTL